MRTCTGYKQLAEKAKLLPDEKSKKILNNLIVCVFDVSENLPPSYVARVPFSVLFAGESEPKMYVQICVY